MAKCPQCIYIYENGHLFVHFTTYTNSEYHTLNFPYVYAWCVNLHKMLTVMALHQVIWNDNPMIYIYRYSNLDRSLTIIFIPKQIRNKSHLWLNPMASLKQISGFRSSHPQSGWWFWNICYFSIYGECHHPNCCSLHDFSEGLVNHQPDICNNPYINHHH